MKNKQKSTFLMFQEGLAMYTATCKDLKQRKAASYMLKNENNFL